MTNIKREGTQEKGKFIIYEEGEKAGEMLFYLDDQHRMVIDETHVDKKFGGRGLAKQLVDEGVAYARENKLKIVPECPYVQHRFKRDESIRDVLAEGTMEIE